MDFAQKGVDYLRSGGSAVLDLLYQRQLSQYWPLESRGNLYIPSSLEEGTPPRKKSKYRNALWAALAVVILLLLGYATKRSTRKSLPKEPYDPGLVYGDTGPKHPIFKLVEDAESSFQASTARQSKTLTEAVAEYRRRYGMPPPPHFQDWYKYAVDSGAQLIDEYDSIHESLLLFWALEPAEIRGRTVEALGYSQSLMGVSVRSGNVHTIGRGQDEWQEPATKEMISQFSKWLPDMDLAFNVNDESRVLVPHEDVERMHEKARGIIQSVQASSNPSFSRPSDLNDGRSYEEVSETRFNRLDHQQTWSHSRMSCPVDSPAREIGGPGEDRKTGFVYGGLEFVYNATAFSDICLVPSVRHSLGLFNHPNVYSVSHDLVPIFSPSKLSPFHDILYPSAYYYADKTVYDSGFAVPWEQKDPKLYWRGATSGGFSQGGSWRTLLRQAILAKLMQPGTVHILERKDDVIDDRPWTPKETSGSKIEDRYDTKFTEIKQCDAQDCNEMRNFFGTHPHTPQEDSWKHRYLLDMDGNALSGRFYALLRSASLPIKVAYYREWHIKRLFPWKHYVPVSASTDEYAEVLRYFEDEADGRKIAENLALQGSDWAQRVVRKKDMEIYMFRLLLEYGRLVDDNRMNLGYSG